MNRRKRGKTRDHWISARPCFAYIGSPLYGDYLRTRPCSSPPGCRAEQRSRGRWTWEQQDTAPEHSRHDARPSFSMCRGYKSAMPRPCPCETQNPPPDNPPDTEDPSHEGSRCTCTGSWPSWLNASALYRLWAAPSLPRRNEKTRAGAMPSLTTRVSWSIPSVCQRSARQASVLLSGAIELDSPYRKQSDDQVTNPRKLRDSAFFPNSHCRIGRPCDCPMRSLHMTSPHLGLT
jgi:hypothetical protein